jgi:hypothetical protein
MPTERTELEQRHTREVKRGAPVVARFAGAPSESAVTRRERSRLFGRDRKERPRGA